MRSVKAVAYETRNYEQESRRLLSDSECESIRKSLAENPAAHDVIPGLGGIRKAR
jgi:hypothetical protein